MARRHLIALPCGRSSFRVPGSNWFSQRPHRRAAKLVSPSSPPHPSAPKQSTSRQLRDLRRYRIRYRVTSYTWPCFSCTLDKVTCPVYTCTVAYTGQGTRKTKSCLTVHTVEKQFYQNVIVFWSNATLFYESLCKSVSLSETKMLISCWKAVIDNR